jgi:hypothetical protein
VPDRKPLISLITTLTYIFNPPVSEVRDSEIRNVSLLLKFESALLKYIFMISVRHQAVVKRSHGRNCARNGIRIRNETDENGEVLS